LSKIACDTSETKEMLANTLSKFNLVLDVIPDAVNNLNKTITTFDKTVLDLNNDLSKAIPAIANSFEDAAKNIAETKTTINNAIASIDKSMPQIKTDFMLFVEAVINIINPLKNVVDSVSNPISGVHKLTSAAGKFIAAFREKLADK